MARLWEIRESYGDRMGHRTNYRDMDDMGVEEREAYDCGYEHGFGDAMKESRHFGERSPYMDERYMGERYMGERGRMRDSMGRYR